MFQIDICINLCMRGFKKLYKVHLLLKVLLPRQTIQNVCPDMYYQTEPNRSLT